MSAAFTPENLHYLSVEFEKIDGVYADLIRSISANRQGYLSFRYIAARLIGESDRFSEYQKAYAWSLSECRSSPAKIAIA